MALPNLLYWLLFSLEHSITAPVSLYPVFAVNEILWPTYHLGLSMKLLLTLFELLPFSWRIVQDVPSQVIVREASEPDDLPVESNISSDLAV